MFKAQKYLEARDFYQDALEIIEAVWTETDLTFNLK